MKTNALCFLGILCLALSSACEKTDPDPSTCLDPHFITENTFTNPLIPRGADPWVTQKNGTYYFTYTQGGKLVLYATKNITELALAPQHDAWIPAPGMPYSKNLWAPELHEIDNKWYMYFAADNGSNANHRMYVVENTSPDPMQGEWTLKGKVADSTDQNATTGLFNVCGERSLRHWPQRLLQITRRYGRLDHLSCPQRTRWGRP